MHLPTVLRVARQSAGLSQRALAGLAGLAPSTLAKAEAGTGTLPADLVDRVLEQCALDLELVARGSGVVDRDEQEALLAHLRLSTTQRLYLALGGTGTWSAGPWPEAYAALARRGGQVLRPHAAMGVWVPGQVCGDPYEDIVDPEPSGHLVPIAVTSWWRVLVPTPLAVRHACSDPEDRRLLLAAASMLAMNPARDDGGRRPPPHRTPDEAAETAALLRSLTYAMRSMHELPEPRESRGWRLDQPVSLEQAMARDGLPRRKGGRRAG